MPQPGSGELLVRIDACGVCFSDIKILNLGGAHPRLAGRDLAAEPVVMGHETAMTVAAVGEALAGRFKVGDRFLIQADIYYSGQGQAFGYRLPGGYSQYQLIGEPVLNGDEGCYLLPAGGMSYAQAALCEPWACVEAAYAYRPRRGIRADGRTLIFLLETSVSTDLLDDLRGGRGIQAVTGVQDPWVHDPARASEGVAGIAAAHPEGFDEVLFYGMPHAELVEEAERLLRPGGVLGIQGRGHGRRARVDIGSVHYRDLWYTGSPEGNIFFWDRTGELVPAGTAWFIGAGGPLGQMHVQRAISNPHPPARIIISQRGVARLAELERRFGAAARARGIDFVLLDAGALGEGVYAAVHELTGGRGCDDIIVVIPSPEVIEKAFTLLARGGGLNIFAGVPVGTRAQLDVGRIPSDGVRLWGTSGSKISDLRRVSERVAAGQLASDRVVAAVGGIGCVARGLEAVRDAAFLGKTVIYPQCGELPLLTLEELADRHPEIGVRLEEGRYWTPAAEEALLALYGAGSE